MIDDGNVARQPYRIEQDGHVVRVIRELKNELQGTLTSQSRALAGGDRLDRTLLLESRAPQTVIVSIRSVPSGAPDEEPRITHLIVMLTPENSRGTYQFVAHAQTFPFVDIERTRVGIRNLLNEDVVAIEAIQVLRDRLGIERCPEYSQKADAGSLYTRKVIAEIIARERSAPSAHAAE